VEKGNAAASSRARDTVFATVRIIGNGVAGLCLLVGSLRHHVLAFRVKGTTPARAVLASRAAIHERVSGSAKKPRCLRCLMIMLFLEAEPV
jgi:Ca2+/H+ antiporter